MDRNIMFALWVYSLFVCVVFVDAKFHMTDECDDVDCYPGYRCVTVFPKNCLNPHVRPEDCHPFPYCLPVTAPTCASTLCQQNTVCLFSETKSCFPPLQPCLPSPTCYPDDQIDGGTNCGSRSCRKNEKCIDVAEHCHPPDNCPTTKTCVPQSTATCANLRCPQFCANLQRPCGSSSCPIEPTCLNLNNGGIPCGTGRCKPNMKCIDVAQTSCQPPSNCPMTKSCAPSNSATCETVDCPPDKNFCANIQTQCIRPPCPIVPTCLAPQGNGERCGQMTCIGDELCIKAYQCLHNGCQMFDHCLPLSEPGCHTTFCDRGHTCKHVATRRCLPTRPTCHPRPQCVKDDDGKICGLLTCRSKELCIVVHDCPNPGCSKGDFCLPEYVPGCHTTRCMPGYTCKHVTTPCARPPCYPVPQCVKEDIGTQCGKLRCNELERCITGHDCLQQGCQKFDYCLPNEVPGCDRITCSKGYTCKYVKVVCVRAPCHPVAQCVKDDDVGTSCGSLTCKGQDLCITAHDCLEPGCNKFDFCLPPHVPGCHSTRCNKGYVCKHVQPRCITAPCYPVPECVREDAGTPCGTLQCDSNERCITGHDCVGNGCQKFDYCLPNNVVGCHTAKCSKGYTCKHVRVDCIRAPCHPIPQCIKDGEQCGQLTCASNERCITGYECPHEGCQKFDHCLPKDAISCANVLCSEGTRCFNLRPSNCFSETCHPVPECVPDKDTKPCGKLTCKASDNCIVGYECPHEGCDKFDYCLPKDEISCANVLCTPNARCFNLRVQCDSPPCHPQPQCIDQTQDKPGKCPPPTPYFGICQHRPENCLSDAECPGNQKCCTEGCGKICKVPTDVHKG